VNPISRIRHPRVTRIRWLLLGLAAIAGLLAFSLSQGFVGGSPGNRRSQALAAARNRHWDTALKYWREINSTKSADGLSHLGEARASLALGRAFQSEQSLRRSIAADPENPEPWRLLLQILRVEDRTLDAWQLGWQACGSVRPDSRTAVLKELTLSLLAELPDDDVRRTLRRWVDADRDDLDARIALIQRIAIQPQADDPDRASLLAKLESIVANHPDHIAARETLVTALADAGEPERGRALLNDWPTNARDSRYWRLRGRWDLEYDNQPQKAAIAFRTVLQELPQDWRSWYRLARALRILGREEESRQAALTVGQIRGALDPLLLRPKLDATLGHLTEPSGLEDLAGLCTRAGLARLGEAWHKEAQSAVRGSDAGPR
jgi:tetratricopeptide (TPR) repeat protein